jgi:RND family efflux transporter MFP subunit
VNRRRNLIVLVVGLVVAVLVGVVAARPRGNGVAARVVTVTYGTYRTKLPETGVVQRPQTRVLAALVAGNIDRIHVRPGAHVTAGELLATIANPQLVNAEQVAHQAYLAAQGRARSTAATNRALPAQNRSAVVQAEAAVEQARFNLNQAIQDQKAGAQSGLGYGGTSAAQQRASADAAVANARTELREKQRLADANHALFAQKAVSRDALDQSIAAAQQAQIAYDQAVRNREETYAQLARQGPVLSDRVQAMRDALTQAQAQLASARAAAAEDKSGDVESARADAAKAYADWRYAADQVARLRISAPFSGIVQSVANESGDTLRPLQPGDAVTVGQAIVTLASDAGFIVRAKIDEQDIANVRVGQTAIVSGEDLGTTTLRGRVAAIGAVAQKSDDPNNTARQIVTTIALEQTVPYLRDGMNVDVDVVTLDRPHVLVVPSEAIRRDANGAPYVLAVVAGRATRRPVTLGTTNDAQSIVRSGVQPGDRLVADRNVALADGVMVTPTSVPSTTPSRQP